MHTDCKMELGKGLFSCHQDEISTEAQQAPYPMGIRGTFLQDKWPERESDFSCMLPSLTMCTALCYKPEVPGFKSR
jgi:hypothetical protein